MPAIDGEPLNVHPQSPPAESSGFLNDYNIKGRQGFFDPYRNGAADPKELVGPRP